MTWESWSQARIDEIPESPGVYAIARYVVFTNSIIWIYVGRTYVRDLRERVQEHYNRTSDQAERIHAQNPTQVGYEVITNYETRKERETFLIALYDPICNG